MVQNNDMRKGTNHLVTNLCIVWNDVSLIRVLRKMYNKREFLLTRLFFARLSLFRLLLHFSCLLLARAVLQLRDVYLHLGNQWMNVWEKNQSFDSWNKNWLLEWPPANDTNHTRSLPHKSNFHLAIEKANPISIFPWPLNNSWLPDRTADTLKQYDSFDVENLCPDPWASNCCFKRLTCFRFCRVYWITFLSDIFS